MGLRNKLWGRAQEEVAKEQRELNEKLGVADAWDDATAGLSLQAEPKRVMAGGLYGDRGSLHFDDLAPDALLELMRTLPPVPAGKHKSSSGTGIRPDAAIDDGQRAEFRPGDGFHLDMSRTESYPTQLTMRWSTNLGGRQVGIWAGVKEVHKVTPVILGDVRQGVAFGRGYHRVDNCRVSGHVPGSMAGVEVVTYRRASEKYFNSFLLWSPREAGGMLKMVEAWVAECERIGEATLAAYERDRQAGVPVPDHYRQDRTPYEQQRLRAGTKAQYECLESEAALQDRALASRHWERYAKDHGIKVSEYSPYFNHYDWACAYLARHGLQPDPNGPNGEPYKYGSAWL